MIFASGKDRKDPQGDLHTNFSLSARGEYLALIDTDGITPLSQFAPEFPKQFFGVAYGTGTNSVTESKTLVPWPATGTWAVPPADIEDSWRLTGFDDSGWNSAQTGIGMVTVFQISLVREGIQFRKCVGSREVLISESLSTLITLPRWWR